MTDREFNDGFRLLMRYFKDIGRFADFKRITARNNPMFKKHLKHEFDTRERPTWPRGMFNTSDRYGWDDFFRFTWFVGTNYEEYNDPCLLQLNRNWLMFLKEYGK